MANKLHLAGPEFKIRPAIEADVNDMSDVFFKSFNAPFWQYLFPEAKRDWLNEAWRIGINNPTDATFVVEDSSQGNRIVAFSRWMLPQQDGNQERKWPEVDENAFDMEVAGAFFGGMEENREEMMGKRAHWMLELLAVHEEYQKRGIGASLIKWGTGQADRDGLESYLDGSEVGQPYYIKRHGFQFGRDVIIPNRPAYGSFLYKSLVRPPQK